MNKKGGNEGTRYFTLLYLLYIKKKKKRKIKWVKIYGFKRQLKKYICIKNFPWHDIFHYIFQFYLYKGFQSVLLQRRDHLCMDMERCRSKGSLKLFPMYVVAVKVITEVKDLQN